MNRARFPDFFIIGAPKCGTTTMFHWLAQHPETYLTTKEPNFFSGDLIDTDKEYGLSRSLNDYLDQICPPESVGLITGEATPKYLYSDAALAALAAEKDRIKIIVLLRNPIELVTSLHGQFLKEGHEPRADFAAAWDASSTKEGKLNDYRMWGLLGDRLEKLFTMFEREQIKVFVLEEDMATAPDAAWAQVTAFLGLSPAPLPALHRTNSATHARVHWINSLTRKLRCWLKRRGIHLAGTGLISIIDRYNRKPGRVAPISPKVRTELQKEFSADVAKTARLLERDHLPWADFFEKRDDV